MTQRDTPAAAQNIPVESIFQEEKTTEPPIVSQVKVTTQKSTLVHAPERAAGTPPDRTDVQTPKTTSETSPIEQEQKTVNGDEKLNLKTLRENWEEIRRQVRNERPQTEGLLNSCKSIAIKNDQIVLGFASDVVKSKMDTKENMALVGSIVSRVLGIEVSIRCVVVDKKLNGAAADTTVEGDGMVNAALGLGGHIIQRD